MLRKNREDNEVKLEEELDETYDNKLVPRARKEKKVLRDANRTESQYEQLWREILLMTKVLSKLNQLNSMITKDSREMIRKDEIYEEEISLTKLLTIGPDVLQNIRKEMISEISELEESLLS